MSTINAKELRINLSTIIPGQTTISFNRQMLYNPENTTSSSNSLSSKPFFTDQVKYPIDKISASYSSIIDFFFNVDIFDSILSEELKKGEVHDKNDIIDHNIMAMLFLLFPTRYPVINDVKNSFDMFRGFDPLKTLFFNPLNRAPFSYLKIGSETYTVQKVIWLNDFLNHPRYRSVLFNPRINMPNTSSSNEDFEKFRKSTSSADLKDDIKGCYMNSCIEPRKKIYVGVDIESSTNSCEIQVMMDLIKGEINNSNINSIYCPLFGEITGNKLAEIFNSFTTNKKKADLHSHRVDTNRYMFSVKDGKSITTEVKDAVNETDLKKIEEENKKWLKIDSRIREHFKDVFERINLRDLISKELYYCDYSKITDKNLILFAIERLDYAIRFSFIFKNFIFTKDEIKSAIQAINSFITKKQSELLNRAYQYNYNPELLKTDICFASALKLIYEELNNQITGGLKRRKTKSTRKQKRRLKQKKYSRKTPY